MINNLIKNNYNKGNVSVENKYLFLYCLLIFISMLIGFTLLDVYFGEILYCAGGWGGELDGRPITENSTTDQGDIILFNSDQPNTSLDPFDLDHMGYHSYRLGVNTNGDEWYQTYHPYTNMNNEVVRSAQFSDSTKIGEINPITTPEINNYTDAHNYDNTDVYLNRTPVFNYSCKEVVVPKKGMFDSIKLGFKFLDSKLDSFESKLESVYIKYHDKGKRKFFWTIWEKERGKYGSYKEFKDSWDPNTGVWKQIKKDIKKDIRVEVEDLLGVKKVKRELKKDVRGEIDDLLRAKRPFARS